MVKSGVLPLFSTINFTFQIFLTNLNTTLAVP